MATRSLDMLVPAIMPKPANAGVGMPPDPVVKYRIESMLWAWPGLRLINSAVSLFAFLLAYHRFVLPRQPRLWP